MPMISERRKRIERRILNAVIRMCNMERQPRAIYLKGEDMVDLIKTYPPRAPDNVAGIPLREGNYSAIYSTNGCRHKV